MAECIEVLEEMIDLEIEDEHSKKESDSECKSQFAKLYKAKPVLTQAERRQKHLELVKLRRNNNIDNLRKLSDVFSDNELEDTVTSNELNVSEENNSLERMEVSTERNKKRRRKKRQNRYQKLMLSEWLMERPYDLETNWMVKLCPEGKRHMVVANYGITKAYNKDGVFIHQFQSALPGGGEYSSNPRNITILDCIFIPQKQWYFVIDIIAWKSMSLHQVDVECRYFWLKSKLDEIPDLAKRNEFTNAYPFFEVETFSVDSLEERLAYPYRANGDDTIALDGILFYLKDVPYIMDFTPLVGWLKPFMIKEMLGMTMHESFCAPPNYTMSEYFAEIRQAKYRRGRRN